MSTRAHEHTSRIYIHVSIAYTGITAYLPRYLYFGYYTNYDHILIFYKVKLIRHSPREKVIKKYMYPILYWMNV